MKKLLVILMALVLCLGIFVACGNKDKGETPDAVVYDVNAAATYVHGLYKDKGPNVTADFEVTSKVMVNDVLYTVEWTATEGVTITKKNDNVFIIDINETTKTAYKFTLTATVKAPDGTTATKAFEMNVPEYVLHTFEEYMAMEQDDIATVRGIVVAINSKSLNNKYNHLFLADESGMGGYYCYALAKDPVADWGIELGMTVEVTGTVAPYSGMQEIKNGTAKIVDATKKTVAPLDVTAAFAAGESFKNYVGMPVTIKGVEIGTQELATETSQYLYFKLNGQSGYVRTYVTDFPTTLPLSKDGDTTVSADKAVIDAAHAEHLGWSANVTGIVVLYNSNPYLIPMGTDCFEYLAKIEKTPEQKIADTLDALTIPAVVNKDGELALPAAGAAYEDVILTWASDNEAAVIGEGKVTFTIPNTATTIKLTVTATCGEATATKEYTVTLTKFLDPNTFVSIPEANTMGAAQAHNTYTEGKYLVTGVVTNIANTTYGNIYIQDADGNQLYVYGLYNYDGKVRFDAMETKPAVGDTITVYGALGQYNNNPQMKNGWLIVAPAADSTLSIPGANALGLGQGHNKYTEGKYSVTGEVTEIANATYGNVYIKDADGNTFYVYGLYTADGATRFDAMETKPAVGDTITVYGIIGQYKNAAQMKNGWMTAHTAAVEGGEEGGEVEGGEETPVTPPASGEVTTVAVGVNYYLAGVHALHFL